MLALLGTLSASAPALAQQGRPAAQPPSPSREVIIIDRSRLYGPPPSPATRPYYPPPPEIGQPMPRPEPLPRMIPRVGGQ
jgi:hypothetical protein